MPTISAKVIIKPRKLRFCGTYNHGGRLMNGPQIRLYGSAFGDSPYVTYICIECAEGSDDPKIIKALEKYYTHPNPTDTKENYGKLAI